MAINKVKISECHVFADEEIEVGFVSRIELITSTIKMAYARQVLMFLCTQSVHGGKAYATMSVVFAGILIHDDGC